MPQQTLPPSNKLSEILKNPNADIHSNVSVIRGVPSISAVPAGATGVFQLLDGSLSTSDGRRVELLYEGAATLPRMQFIQCGNSLSEVDRLDQGSNIGITPRSCVQKVNNLAGNPFKFSTVQAVKTTNMDVFGIYGYGGATSSAILAAIQVNWIDIVVASGVVPDVVCLRGFHENDGALSLAQKKVNYHLWQRMVETAWPNAKLLLIAPYPTTLNDTPQEQADYLDLYAWYKAKDDGAHIFVADANAHADPANLSQPVLTLTNGSDGTHPSVTASWMLARDEVAVVKRIAKSFYDSVVWQSINLFATGSSAITADAKHSGVMPNPGFYVSQQAGSVYTVVGAKDAIDDAFIVTYTTPGDTGSAVDCGWILGGDITLAAAATRVAGRMTIELISGAANLKYLVLDTRVTDNAVAQPLKVLSQAPSATVGGGLLDGDVLDIYQVPNIAIAGTGITKYQNWLRVVMQPTGGSVTFKIKKQGCKALVLV